jgi:hypothetical protein
MTVTQVDWGAHCLPAVVGALAFWRWCLRHRELFDIDVSYDLPLYRQSASFIQ